jgi:hypothetical protein
VIDTSQGGRALSAYSSRASPRARSVPPRTAGAGQVEVRVRADAILTAYPRLSMERSLVDAIVDQATRTPTKAPRYSIAAILIRERTTRRS